MLKKGVCRICQETRSDGSTTRDCWQFCRLIYILSTSRVLPLLFYKCDSIFMCRPTICNQQQIRYDHKTPESKLDTHFTVVYICALMFYNASLQRRFDVIRHVARAKPTSSQPEPVEHWLAFQAKSDWETNLHKFTLARTSERWETNIELGAKSRINSLCKFAWKLE